MIDTDKYEERTTGYWSITSIRDGSIPCNTADEELCADAPLLLKEVKRLYQAITDIADEMEQVSLTEYEQEVIEDLRKVIETQNIINQYDPKIVFCYDFPKDSAYHGRIISTLKWKAIEYNWNYGHYTDADDFARIKKWHEEQKATDPSYNNDEYFLKLRWRRLNEKI